MKSPDFNTPACASQQSPVAWLPPSLFSLGSDTWFLLTWLFPAWSTFTFLPFLLLSLQGRQTNSKAACSTHWPGDHGNCFILPGQQPQDVHSWTSWASSLWPEMAWWYDRSQGENHFSDMSETCDLECSTSPPLASSLSLPLSSVTVSSTPPVPADKTSIWQGSKVKWIAVGNCWQTHPHHPPWMEFLCR